MAQPTRNQVWILQKEFSSNHSMILWFYEYILRENWGLRWVELPSAWVWQAPQLSHQIKHQSGLGSWFMVTESYQKQPISRNISLSLLSYKEYKSNSSLQGLINTICNGNAKKRFSNINTTFFFYFPFFFIPPWIHLLNTCSTYHSNDSNQQIGQLACCKHQP